MISNLSVPLVGIVDTAVMGRIDNPAYIGAIALGALIFSFLYWGFGFLRMGSTGLAAQNFGAGNTEEITALALRGFLIAAVVSLIILLVQTPVLKLSLSVLSGSAEVEALTARYYNIRVLSAPAVLLTYVVLGILIGIQRTRDALIIQLVLNLSNVVLDIVFVIGLGLGVEGVGWATVISEYLALVLGLVILARSLSVPLNAVPIKTIVDRYRLRELVDVNSNLIVRNFCIIFTHSWFTAQSTRFGETTLAANAILIHLVHVLAYGLDGFAHAAEALVGEAYGRKSAAHFRSAVRITTQWAIAMAVAFIALYAVTGGTVIDLMSTNEGVRETARTFLPWVLVAPLVAVWSYQFDGIFIGSTHTAEMRNGMLISMAVFAIASATVVPEFGNHGLWIAFIVFTAARGVTLGWWYPRVRDNVIARSRA